MKHRFQWRCAPHVSNKHSYVTKLNYIWPIYLFSLVDPDEIKRLGKRFRKLDLDNSGSLSVDEFMSLPELQQNPLVQRVIDIFDTDGNGEVDFKGKIVGRVRTILLIDSCDLQNSFKEYLNLASKATKNQN